MFLKIGCIVRGTKASIPDILPEYVLLHVWPLCSWGIGVTQQSVKSVVKKLVLGMLFKRDCRFAAFWYKYGILCPLNPDAFLFCALEVFMGSHAYFWLVLIWPYMCLKVMPLGNVFKYMQFQVSWSVILFIFVIILCIIIFICIMCNSIFYCLHILTPYRIHRMVCVGTWMCKIDPTCMTYDTPECVGCSSMLRVLDPHRYFLSSLVLNLICYLSFSWLKRCLCFFLTER